MLSDYVNSWPTDRTRHRCGVCGRLVLPGETYWRQASMDGSTAWTHKTCEHCRRVVHAYARCTGEDEWDRQDGLEWLHETGRSKRRR